MQTNGFFGIISAIERNYSIFRRDKRDGYIEGVYDSIECKTAKRNLAAHTGLWRKGYYIGLEDGAHFLAEYVKRQTSNAQVQDLLDKHRSS